MMKSEKEDLIVYGTSITHPSRLDSAAPARTQRYNYANQPEQRTEHSSLVLGSPQYNSEQKINKYSSAYANDSLEYFIKFPTSHFANGNDAPESDYLFTHNEDYIPIVLLLGWAGCQDRYLMKYSKIYEDRGLITIRYTAPVETLFWNRNAMLPIGEKILKLIYDMNLDSHPLIFHVFSNGGAFLYQHISLAMRKHKRPIQIRGMIFDSAPGDRRILGLYRAVSAIYSKENKKCNCLTSIFITVSLSLMWFIEESFSAFKSLFVKTEPVQKNPFHDIKNDPNLRPQLFLYSKNDALIPYKDVENFIKHRKQLGVEVSSMCFDDAEHVKIFAKYPSQYIRCVCTFINNCLTIPYKCLTPLSTPTSECSTKKSD